MDMVWGNIFGGGKKAQDPVTGLLRNVPLFEGLSPREMHKVRELVHHRSYLPGEVVFSQGISGFGMYIIESGNVNILDEPSGRLIAELGAGDFFGEVALLADIPRSASAVAVSQARLYGFFHSDLKSLVEHNPKMGVKIALRLATVIAERLVAANTSLLELQAAADDKAQQR